MTYFTDLSVRYQNIVMLNFEFFAKKFLLGFSIAFVIFYLFYWRKYQEETPYLFVGVLRTILYYVCKVYLYTFPLFIFFLFPQIQVDRVLQFMLLFYTIAFFIAGSVVLLNILYFGPMVLVKIAGYNPDKRTDQVVDLTIGKVVKDVMGVKKYKLPDFYRKGRLK